MNGSTDVEFLQSSDIKKPIEIIWEQHLVFLIRILLQGVFVPLIVEDESLTLDVVAMSQEGLKLGVVVGEEGDESVSTDYVQGWQVPVRLPDGPLPHLDDVDETQVVVGVHVADVDTLQSQQDPLSALQHESEVEGGQSLQSPRLHAV